MVVDAGPLYAYVDATDGAHAASVDLLRGHRGVLFVPVLVIAEVVHLIGERLGPLAEARFLSDVASGDFTVEPVHAMDWERIAELVARYHDMRLGTVDASVVAAAERLGITAIATLDRRHFSVVRPRHVEAFALPLLE